jgi:hypothetical protein
MPDEHNTTARRDRPLYSGARLQHMDEAWLRVMLQGAREYMRAHPCVAAAYASQIAVYRAELRRRGLPATLAPYAVASA